MMAGVIMQATRYEGSCLCGAITWRAEEPFLDMLHCHCVDCRKTHGAAFATSIGVARDRFAILSGAGHMKSFTAPSGTRRSFCARCGTKVTIENDAWDATYVPASTFDTPPPHRPQMHMYVASRAPWFEIHDDLPRYDTAPPDDYRDKLPPLKR
jgi:hypothetical protein